VSGARIFLAEAIGTFTFIFVGVLSITAGPPAGPAAVSLATIAFAHGLAIAVMVAALGAVSGGHFNPAVTFGFVATGRMTIPRGLLYWAAQLLGAVVAAAVVRFTVGNAAVSMGTPDVAPTVGILSAVILEAIGTFFLVLVVFGTAVDERAPKSVYPFAIGLTITLSIMAIGPLTGGAVNPARAFGPALVSGHWTNHLVYWAGPLLGGALAGWVANGVFLEKAPTPAVAEKGGPAPSEERAV